MVIPFASPLLSALGRAVCTKVVPDSQPFQRRLASTSLLNSKVRTEARLSHPPLKRLRRAKICGMNEEDKIGLQLRVGDNLANCPTMQLVYFAVVSASRPSLSHTTPGNAPARGRARD